MCLTTINITQAQNSRGDTKGMRCLRRKHRQREETMDTQGRPAVKIAFVILTWNQREKTMKCLANLRTVREPSFHVVLWDNGSSDGTVEAVREAFPEVLAHHHTDNLGVAPGRNAAAEFAIKKLNPTHLLFLDNDM